MRTATAASGTEECSTLVDPWEASHTLAFHVHQSAENELKLESWTGVSGSWKLGDTGVGSSPLG